jgi:TRAP-type C4-dicarboxylate transport system permease small subunit
LSESTTQKNSAESDLPGFLGLVDTAIAKIEAVMLAAGVLLMAANTVANVIGRFVLKSSIFFTEELNSILIVLITFAGISYAARHGRHIRMSAIFDTLPPAGRRVMMILISAVTAVFMFGLAWYALGYIITQAGQGRVLPALQVRVWWMYIWVPVGFFMTGVQYALTAVKNLTHEDVWLSTLVLEGYEEKETEV